MKQIALNGRVAGYLLLPAVAAVISCTTDPQPTGAIGGTVADSASGAPIEAATVGLCGGGRSSTTATDGRYLLDGVLIGEAAVCVSAPGFREASMTVVVLQDETTTTDFLLDAAVVPQAPPMPSASLHGFDVRLYWLPSPPAHIESYNVYWSRTPGVSRATGERVAGGFYEDRPEWSPSAVLLHDHIGLSEGSYYYVVTAENDVGESPASPELHIMVSGTDLNLWEPLPFSTTSDSVKVIAPAAASVTATLDGETIELQPRPQAILIPWSGNCIAGWAGAFQSIIASGSKVLILQALDADGREAQTQVSFTFAPDAHGPRGTCF